MKKPKYLYDYIVFGLVTAMFIVLIFGCRSTKMVQTKYGIVHKYQIEEIEKVRRNNQ